VLGHPGKCKQLHGHNYSIEIRIEYDSKLRSPVRGYFIDFGRIKSDVKFWVDANLDHSTILQRGDALVEAIEKGAHNQKIVELHIPPTAEGLSPTIVRYLKYEVMVPYVREGWGKDCGYLLLEVEVFETATCSATARESIDGTP